MREAPAITVIDGLIDAGAEVVAHDPAAMANFAHLLPDVDMAGTAEEALLDADAVVLLTEWADYAQLPWAELRQTMARPLVIDLRNHLDGALLRALGYEYLGLGRTLLPPETTLADSLQQPIAAE